MRKHTAGASSSPEHPVLPCMDEVSSSGKGQLRRSLGLLAHPFHALNALW
jgi:hypothetical protein